MLPIRQMFLTNHNRPQFKLKKLKGIVIHWTANTGKGANAVANRNYFNSTDRAASAHFIVDDRQIVQCIPENEVAYHVGASTYKTAGQKIKEGAYGPNYFLIGIEMCVNRDGNWNKTYQNTVELAAYLIKKYKLSIKDLYRHYDITGKDCPKMMVNEKEWAKFKNAVNILLNPIKKGQVLATKLNIRKGAGTNFDVVGTYSKGDIIEILEENNGWYRTSKGWISSNYVTLL